jgi:hypothetical protein
VSSDDELERAWVTNYVPKGTAQDSINQIKEYAFLAFDTLDKNKNGFIERTELEAALSDAEVGPREKSFITFLLTNQNAIAEQVREDPHGPMHGISRLDLNAYFKLLLQMMG